MSPMCVRGIYFEFALTIFLVEFWNCSDAVVLFVFIIVHDLFESRILCVFFVFFLHVMCFKGWSFNQMWRYFAILKVYLTDSTFQNLLQEIRHCHVKLSHIIPNLIQ